MTILDFTTAIAMPPPRTRGIVAMTHSATWLRRAKAPPPQARAPRCLETRRTLPTERRRFTSHGAAIISMLLTAFVATACTPQMLAYQPALQADGELHLYLQPLPQEAYRIDFTISDISAVRSEGDAIPIPQVLSELHGKELQDAQRRLASGPLSPGVYKGLTIQLSEASLLTEEGPTALLVPQDPLFLEQEFTIVRRRATALFLSLDPTNLLSAAFRFTPLFSPATSRRQLNNLVGFATNARANVVSVFNKNTMQIVDIVATGSGPTGAALDQLNGWLYVALAGDDSIEIIQVNTGDILGRVKLNFGDQPGEIALSPDGRTLVSANTGSNTASIVDTRSLREVARINLPSEPTSVVVGPSLPRAYLFQPAANAISIIDLSRRTLVRSRTLEETPIRGALSKDADALYVITRDSPNLLVIDPVNLTPVTRIFVGIAASSIKVDGTTGLVYVGRKTGAIAVLDPSSLLSIDTFNVRGNAVFLTIDNEESALLAVLPDNNSVKKLDLVSKKLLGAVEVYAGAYAVAVMGER